MRSFFLYGILAIFLSSTLAYTQENDKKITYTAKDREILDNAFNFLEPYKNLPEGELVVKTGEFFLGTPYVAHTLEISPEHLVVNLREMDCTTFAENCLAIARTVKTDHPDFNRFTKELTYIRYRNGKIENYTSRLHYFSDWILENDAKGLVKNVTEEISHIPFHPEIYFMSTHPESYKQLKSHPEFIPVIARQEKALTNKPKFYISKDRISEFENRLKPGDIIGITTSIKGMDIQHVGILVEKAGRIHLMHESSKAKKVIITENTLEDYLLHNKTATGIMVARAL